MKLIRALIALIAILTAIFYFLSLKGPVVLPKKKPDTLSARYQKILHDNPGNPDTLEGIALTHQWDGRTHEAFLYFLYNEIKNHKNPQVDQLNRQGRSAAKRAMGIILVVVCVAMLGLIGFSEGWGKALQILGILYLVWVVITEIFLLSGSQKYFFLPSAFNDFQWALWDLGLGVYWLLRTKTRIISLFKKYILLCVVFAPILVACLFVFRYGVNTIYSDQWRAAPLFVKYAEGTLTFADFFRNIECHRELFPNCIAFFLGLLTGYSTIAELYANVFFITMAFCIILFALKKQVPFTARNLFFFVPITYLLFSPEQMRTVLYGAGLGWFLVNAAVIASLYFLYTAITQQDAKKAIFKLAIAIVCSTIATFSSGMWICVWFAGFIQIIVSRSLSFRKQRFMLGGWVAAGLLESLLYLNNWHFFTQQIARPVLTGLSKATENPFSYLQFFPMFLGRAFVGKQEPLIWGIALSSLLVISILLLYTHKLAKENALWISIFAFAACAAFEIFVGRVCLKTDLSEGLLTRYPTISLLLVVPVYIVILNLFLTVRNNFVVMIVYAAIVCLVIISISFSFSNGLRLAAERNRVSSEAAAILTTYENQSDYALNEISGGKSAIVRQYAPALKRLRYNVFK